MSLLDKFKKAKEALGNPYPGGSTRYKDVAFFQHIKPSSPTLWHSVKDGDEEIILMIVQHKKK